MALSAFDDRAKPPRAADLERVLRRAVRLEIKNKKDLEIVKKLAAIKMAN